MHHLRKYRAYNSGDMIEVKLSDTGYNLYYRTKVNISNKKRMLQLKEDLKHYGIEFEKMKLERRKKNWWDG